MDSRATSYVPTERLLLTAAGGDVDGLNGNAGDHLGVAAPAAAATLRLLPRRLNYKLCVKIFRIQTRISLLMMVFIVTQYV